MNSANALDKAPVAPVIGIVVPAYRSERFLAQTLQSIKDQTWRAWECIVVDDGSQDRTGLVGAAFERDDSRFRVVSQGNAGTAAARNRGLLELASSVEYVTCMDSDDIYLPEALEKLKTALDSSPGAVGVHALAEFIDEYGQPMDPGVFAELGRNRVKGTGNRLSPLPVTEATSFASVITASTIFPPGLLLMRREIVDRVGAYDETVTLAEDWDYIIRLCRYGEVKFLDEVILYYRRHGSNQGTQLKVPEMCRRVQHKAYFSRENSTEHQRIVLASWKANQRYLLARRMNEAAEHLKAGDIIKAIERLARTPFIAFRYLRGAPSLGWL